jgi:hypothetical protein
MNTDPGNLSYNPFGGSNKGGGGGGGGGQSSAGGFLLGLNLLKKFGVGGNKQALTSGAPSLDQAPTSPGSSLDDQILALQMAAIDARYGGDGGASAAAKSYHPGPAPAMQQYSGPTIDELNQYTNTGRTNIEQSYGNLANFVASQLPQTQDIYNQGGAAQQAAYTKAAQNIQGAVTSGQQALNVNPASAGAAAAVDQKKAVADVLARYQSTNAQNQLSAAQKNQANLAMQASNNALRVTGDRHAGDEALYRFVAGTNLQKSQAQLQMDQIAASNKAKMDQYNQQESYKKADIMNRAAAAQSGNADKAQAAKLDLLAKVLGTQAKAGTHLSGVQGVLAYGNQQGNPNAATSFLKMVADARNIAETKNMDAKNDPSGQTKTTTAQAELQNLMMGTKPDPTDTQGMIDLVRNTPALSSLQKYALWAPQQVYNNQELQDQLFPGARAQVAKLVGKLGNKTSFDDLMNQGVAKSFKPTFNMQALQKNPTDYATYQNYLNQQQNSSDLYNSMWEIYQGKYGSGM